MSKTAILCLFVTGVLGVMSGGRADDVLPGHSHYGEAFNRGPRRNAYLMGGTGNVHLPISTKSPLAQRFFDQGIGQLHGFWYGEAERSFREVLRLDPNCGMAYWGLAQAAIIDKKRAAQFAADARKHKMGLSEREQMYIDALGNESGYRPLIAKYPNELEAKAFEVWRQWHIAEAGGGVAGDLEGGFTLAQEILKVAPMHPIHHAVIHIADGTHTYKRGLDSAPKCGEAAPSIGHMWHMPTHIYASLKRYPEAAWQLEACLRTNNARTMHDHVMPYQVELYTHNNEWLIRMLMHMGRVREARRVAQEMIDYPRHPRFNAMEPPEEPVKKKSQAKKSKTEPSESDESGQDQTHESHGASAYYGRDRLFQLLRRFEYWDELIEDCRSGYLEATRMPAEQGKRHANLGVAYYSSGDVPDGDRELAAIRRLRDEQAVEREAAFEEVSRRPEVEQSAAASAVEKRFNRRLASLETQIDQLQAYRRIVTGVFLSRGQLVLYLGILAGVEVILLWILRRRMMRALLSGVAALVVAGWLVYCHLALVNLPDDAVNVDFAFVTRKQMDVGDFDQAVWSAVRFAGERPRQVRPLANLVEALSKSGNKAQARREFESLRELAGLADLDSPPLARLAPIAKEFGFPTDWRKPQKINEVLSTRRPLPSLGPLEWRPWAAPSWKLVDSAGHPHELDEFRGKPVVLVFFLGRGCLHCQQQLAAFAKKAGELKEAGLSVITVSTDDQAGAKKSVDSFGSSGAGFPFLMLADPKLDVFRTYGAFDDFEQIALHGTYLIDGNGRVRWNDVSFEPFMNADFLLSEAKRLLSRPVAPIEPDARVIADR